jgi:hypothetical protein
MATSDLFLFVSHVAENRDAAMEIVDELERRGTRCWIAPRDVRPGEPFDNEIADAIETSRAMLLIFSDLCNDSEYIRREVTVAGESHKTVIPFRIEDVQPRRGLRVRLSDLHWIDGFVSRERAIDEVIKKFAPSVVKPTPLNGDVPQKIVTAEADSKPIDRDPTNRPDLPRHRAGVVNRSPDKSVGAASAKRRPIMIGGAVAVALAGIVIVVATSHQETPPAPPTRASNPCGAIVGSWDWFNGAVVVFKLDGTVRTTGNSGTWTCSDGNYVTSWSVGGWVDRFRISTDGTRIDGSNGTSHLSAIRK